MGYQTYLGIQLLTTRIGSLIFYEPGAAACSGSPPEYNEAPDLRGDGEVAEWLDRCLNNLMTSNRYINFTACLNLCTSGERSLVYL